MATYSMQQTDTPSPCAIIAACSGQGLDKIPQDRQAERGGTPGTIERFITLSANGVTNASAMVCSKVNEPGEVSWEAGDWTVRLNVTTGQMNVTLEEVYICRISAGCVSQETVGSQTGLGISLASAGVITRTFSGLPAVAALVDDLIYIVWVMSNSFSGVRNLGVTFDQIDDTPILIGAAAAFGDLVSRRKPMAPVLERSRTLADGLQFCTPFYEGEFVAAAPSNDEIQDLVGAAGNLKRAAGGTMSWSEDEYGPKVGATVVPKYAVADFADGAIGTIKDPFTLLWFGRWPSADITNLNTLFWWGDGFTFPLGQAWVEWRDSTSTFQVLVQIDTQSRSINVPSAGLLDAPLLLIMRHSLDSGLLVDANGEHFGPNLNPLTGSPGREANTIVINGRKLISTFFDVHQGSAEHHILAKWGRLLSDAEVSSLLTDPFLVTREDRSLHPWRYPIHARMPCPEFPIQRMLLKPIDQVSPKDGGILHAAKANRIDIDEVDIRLAALDDEEVAMLLNCWNNGLGQVDPFWMRLPEEDEERLYVFRDSRLAIVHGSTAARGTVAKLRDVTRFGNP